MPQAATADPVADLLTASPLTTSDRRKVWDLYQQSSDEDDLAAQLVKIGIPKTVKHDLWELKYQASQAATPEAVAPPIAEPQPDPGTSGALTGTAVASGVPMLGRVAEEVATNPNVPRYASNVLRVATPIAATAVGGATYGPAGAGAGLYGAVKADYRTGRVGWNAGKLTQKAVAGPVARAVEAAAPYLKVLGTLSGAQAVLDLAQMADPKRTDIGVLGVGVNTSESLKRERDQGIPPAPTVTDYAHMLVNVIKSFTGDPERVTPAKAQAVIALDRQLQDRQPLTPIQAATLKRLFAELPKR